MSKLVHLRTTILVLTIYLFLAAFVSVCDAAPRMPQQQDNSVLGPKIKGVQLGMVMKDTDFVKLVLEHANASGEGSVTIKFVNDETRGESRILDVKKSEDIAKIADYRSLSQIMIHGAKTGGDIDFGWRAERLPENPELCRITRYFLTAEEFGAEKMAIRAFAQVLTDTYGITRMRNTGFWNDEWITYEEDDSINGWKVHAWGGDDYTRFLRVETAVTVADLSLGENKAVSRANSNPEPSGSYVLLGPTESPGQMLQNMSKLIYGTRAASPSETSAAADVKDYKRFSITVPGGWSAQDKPDSKEFEDKYFIAPDNRHALTVMVRSIEELQMYKGFESFKDLANVLHDAGMGEPLEVTDTYTVNKPFENRGSILQQKNYLRNDQCLMVTFITPDGKITEIQEAAVDSIKIK
jgi:hypothetical protein